MENNNNEKSFEEKARETFENVMDTKDLTGEYDKKDIENNKVMAILCYILPFIPYFVEKNSKWVRFHAIQGMNLLIYSIIYYAAANILSVVLFFTFIADILNLVGLVFTVLAIIGIINVLNGKAKELPLIEKMKIIKE